MVDSDMLFIPWKKPAPIVSAFSLFTMGRKCTKLCSKNFGVNERMAIVNLSSPLHCEFCLHNYYAVAF